MESERLMTSDLIKNDKKFIISGLGKNDQKILRKQCIEFESSALKERILYIKKLIDKIIKHKKTSL